MNAVFNLICEEAWREYVTIQMSGATNMLDLEHVRTICAWKGFDALAQVIEDYNYTLILQHYDKLEQHYGKD